MCVLLGCSTSSEPVLPADLQSEVVPLPNNLFPGGGDYRDTRLVARGDHAIVLGLGECIGKAADRCLAGTPMVLRRNRPDSVSSLRGESLLWPQLAGDGTAFFQRLRTGGEPELFRIDTDGSSSRIRLAVQSNPMLHGAVDGSVLVVAEEETTRRVYRVDARGEEPVLAGDWFSIQTVGDATYVQAHGESQHLLAIRPDGSQAELIRSASVVLDVNLGEHPVSRRHICYVAGGERRFLVLDDGVVNANLPVPGGDCSSLRARSTGASYWFWDGRDRAALYHWQPGDDSPRVSMETVLPDAEVMVTGAGFAVADSETLTLLDENARPLQSGDVPSDGFSLLAGGGQAAVFWVRDGALGVSFLRDGEIVDHPLAPGEDVFLNPSGTWRWLDESGVAWIITSDRPIYRVYRVDPEGVSRLDDLRSERIGVIPGQPTLVSSADGVFSFGATIERLGDADGSARELAPGVLVFPRGGEQIIASWIDGELVELGPSENPDVRETPTGTWALLTDAEGQRVARLGDHGLELVTSADSVRWISQRGLVLTRGDATEVCAFGDALTCVDVPIAGAEFPWGVRFTDTGRMLGVARTSERPEELLLWYTRVD